MVDIPVFYNCDMQIFGVEAAFTIPMIQVTSPLQRDYDKAEQECQRYKTLYDAAKEEVSVLCTCVYEFPNKYCNSSKNQHL